MAGARAALRDAQSRHVQIRVARTDAILRLQDGDDSIAKDVLDP